MLIYADDIKYIDLENDNLVIKVKLTNGTLKSVFNSIETLKGKAGENLIDYLANNINKIDELHTFILAYDVLKNHAKIKIDMSILKHLLDNIYTFSHGYGDAFEIYKILKENNIDDKETIDILVKKLEIELHYIINNRFFEDIKEFASFGMKNDIYKELLIVTLKKLLNEVCNDIRDSLKKWIKCPQYCYDIINIMSLINIIFNTELINYLRDEIENLKVVVKRFNDEINNKLVEISIERVKKGKYVDESITLLKLLDKTDSNLLKYLV